MSDRATQLNADCRAGLLDLDRLQQELRAQGEPFFQVVSEQCPNLFSGITCFISSRHYERMLAVIAAVEQVVSLPAWARSVGLGDGSAAAQGAFMGYDFHLNADGAHLIEINTNAGGGYLSALLLRSQDSAVFQGKVAAQEALDGIFLEMFRSEWQRERGSAALQSIAIVDAQPQQQYLYPEFLLAQQSFRQAGIAALIADPAELELRGDGLYCGATRIDMVYNRLTDFSLEQHPMLNAAWQAGQVVLTPHPQVYRRYADKRNLALLTDDHTMAGMGVAQDVIAVLQSGIPQVRLVQPDQYDYWWVERKQWFFKPATGYGARGSYRGAGITRRVFDEIMQGGYVAQKLAVPGERTICVDGQAVPLKADVRCYVYAGSVQLVVARLYQGQTTNMRTPGGGFSPVTVVD